VLGGGPAAGPVAVGQPVGQAEVGDDDPLPDDRIPGVGVLPEPAFDAVDGDLVTREDVIDGRVRPGRVDHWLLPKSVVHGGSEDESNWNRSTPCSSGPQPQTLPPER